MAFLIESLLASGQVVRQDKKRLTVTRRPQPARPRDFFELLALMGNNATIEGLMRAVPSQGADPRLVFASMLERWPTAQELADLPQPYAVHRHMRAVLRGEEFRRPLARRLCGAYPERIRLLYVRIPRCAGTSVMNVLQQKHPVMRLDLGETAYADPGMLVPLLGQLMSSFGTTRTLVFEQPNIGVYLDAPAVAAPSVDTLRWQLPTPPSRAMDVLFAIVRPPEELVLSAVNAMLTALQQPVADDEPTQLTDLRRQCAPLPSPQPAAAWKDLGRRLLTTLGQRNPICAALGDGTAAGAITQCGRSMIQLVPIHEYTQWCRSVFDCSPPDIMEASTPFLRPDDLSDTERAHLRGLVAEDMQFYARFEAQRTALEMPFLKGGEL